MAEQETRKLQHMQEKQTTPSNENPSMWDTKAWNPADRVLFASFVLFLAMLALHVAYPASVAARGLLWVAEAALVGGVADWFAVTALFRKPLGFPYHTAILPRRRQAFIDAVAKLIEREFFSRKRLFQVTAAYDWRPHLLRALTSDAIRETCRAAVLRQVRRTASSFDATEEANAIAARMRHAILRVSLPSLVTDLSAWLCEDARGEKLFASAATHFCARAEDAATRARILETLEKLRDDKLATLGVMERLMASMAQATGVIDLPELASILQNEIVRALQGVVARDGNEPCEIDANDASAPTADASLAGKLCDLFCAACTRMAQDVKVQDTFAEVQGALLRALPLTEEVTATLKRVQNALAVDAADASKVADGGALPAAVSALVDAEIARAMRVLHEDADVARQVDTLLYDVVARCTLQAQAMCGLIAREVMAHMTDEQLNRMVYSKIEPDMIWIRMNGSVLGAGLGALLFLVRTAWQRMF